MLLKLVGHIYVVEISWSHLCGWNWLIISIWLKLVDHIYVVQSGWSHLCGWNWFWILDKVPCMYFSSNFFFFKLKKTFHNCVCFLREELTLVFVCFVGLSSITCVCFVMEELTPVLVHLVYPPIACVCFVRGELTPVLKNLKQNNVWGCTSGRVYVPCIYTHARWELL